MISPQRQEAMVKVALWACGLISVSILVVIVAYVFTRGSYIVNFEFLTGSPYRFEYGGIFPQIMGSLYLVSFCSLFAAPLGILSAIYLAEYAPDNFITRTIRFFIETLAGIPSIIIGLFGLVFLVVFLNFKISLLSGSLALALMVLPWMIRVSEEAIKAVPDSYREASLALGASKWQTIKGVVLSCAAPGIITGILLGVGKAIGETVVVLLTAGSGLEPFLPRSLSDPVGSLPVYTYLLATQGHTSAAVDRAFGSSLVLILMFLIMSISALFIRNYYYKKMGVRLK